MNDHIPDSVYRVRSWKRRTRTRPMPEPRPDTQLEKVGWQVSAALGVLLIPLFLCVATLIILGIIMGTTPSILDAIR